MNVYNPTRSNYIGWNATSLKLEALDAPASHIIICESSNVWLWDWREVDGSQSLFPRLRRHHNEGMNCTFADGYVKWQRYVCLTRMSFYGLTPGSSPP